MQPAAHDFQMSEGNGHSNGEEKRKGAPAGNQFAKGNKGGGRPTAYRRAYIRIVRKLCELGATDREVSEAVGISLVTLYEWRNKHKEFSLAWASGKTAADIRVARSLYKRALGYEQPAVKIFMPAGAAEPVYAPYTEVIAPDTAAATFWLKCRDPEFKERTQLEHVGVNGGPIQTEVIVSPQRESEILNYLQTRAPGLESSVNGNGNGNGKH